MYAKWGDFSCTTKSGVDIFKCKTLCQPRVAPTGSTACGGTLKRSKIQIGAPKNAQTSTLHDFLISQRIVRKCLDPGVS